MSSEPLPPTPTTVKAVDEMPAAQTRSTIEWATFYLQKGWRVLPIWPVIHAHCACPLGFECKSPGKHPLGSLAPNGVNSATNDLAVVEQWLLNSPSMNIAIATGSASNLIVLDLDLKEDVDGNIIDGEFELKSWLASHGFDVPLSMTQHTGGGGLHILLTWPDLQPSLRPAIASRTNWLPGVDIRADGGYIVAAPSQHVSGKLYYWENEEILDTVSTSLLYALTNERKALTSASSTNAHTTGTHLGNPTHSMDVNALMISGFRMGERDDGFTRLAGILRARGDSLDTAQIIVRAVWLKTDQREGDVYELDTAYEKLRRGYKNWEAPEELSEGQIAWARRVDAKAALRAEATQNSSVLLQQQPKSLPLTPISPPQKEPALITEGRSFTPEPPNATVPSHMKEGDTHHDKESTDNEDFIDDEEDDHSPSDPFDIAALMEGDNLQRELPTMLRRNDGKCLLYAGKVHSIYGEPGHGKTWVSLFVVKERLELGESVAYLDYDEDDGGRSMALRLRSLNVRPGVVRDQLHYFNPAGMGHDSTQWQHLKDQLLEWQPSLVVVDTMAPALVELGLNEKDNAEVGAWYAHAKWLLRGMRPKAALLIIDHVVKNGEGRGRWARGAGDKLGRVHAAYGVESSAPFSRTSSGYIRLLIAKDRGGEVGSQDTIAAIVKFAPFDNGERLNIEIESPTGNNDYAELARETALREQTLRERITFMLSVTQDTRGMLLSELQKETRDVTRDIEGVLTALLAEGMIATNTQGRTVRFMLAPKGQRSEEDVATEDAEEGEEDDEQSQEDQNPFE